MTKPKSRWLRGCAISCSVLVVLILVLSVGGSIVMMTPFRDAVEMRETLVERHGEVDEFTPWPDGGIPPERLDAFLHVRRGVQQHCAEIGVTDAGIEAMDRLDDKEKPGTMEILGAFGEASKSVFGMGGVTGRFFRARNEALLEIDMSLGEYTYIYVLAYGPAIVGKDGGEEEVAGAAHLSVRVRETLRLQLRNRLAAMDGQGEVWKGTEEHRLLVQEIAGLDEHPERLPWCGVRPPALRASLGPYEERLAGLFCADAVHLELTRNRSFGIGIEGD